MVAKGKDKIYETLFKVLFGLALVSVLIVPFLTGSIIDNEPTPSGNEGSYSPRFQLRDATLAEDAQVIVRHRHRDCSLDVSHLTEEFRRLTLGGATEKNISRLLGDGWDIAVFEADKLVVEYSRELCPVCEDLGYISLYGRRIAVYSGVPPRGVLEEITDYEVKEIYKEELRQGIPFSSEQEKKSILESYTT